MAEQTEPVRRMVALKVIKAGMDSESILARFEAERQALALMDHQNIARVFEAGTTEAGRPYFVMELVKGIPLTKFCDERRLSIRERLELFIPVCQAIQHAHQKGVIHRDVKPSNILVALYDGRPVPKVIDFGIAKATGHQLTERTLFTEFGALIGTPEYMSPEQAEMNQIDIDTRSDIYSLGVLLYELLTGTTPLNRETIRQAAFDEILRRVREEQPPKPSTRLTASKDRLAALCAQRQIEPAHLTKLMRGDIDWIVMKALEKDRSRRYETANGLAMDLQRHLQNEPVLASPPSTLYRLQKLFLRNKVVFAAGTCVVVALTSGVAVSMSQGVRAKRALLELRATAPAFAEQARGLADQERYDEAIEKLTYANRLRPDRPEYLIAKGNLLECQLRLSEAVRAYRGAIALDPSSPIAQTNLKLCERLLLVNPAGTKLPREALAELFKLMQQDQRPPAELRPVARLVGRETEVLVNLWLTKLKALPLPPERPLAKRLTLREDGLLALDISGTKLASLEALNGMPLGALDCSGCEEINDVSPLTSAPLKELDARKTRIIDLSPLSRIRSLERLNLPAGVVDLSPLRGLRLRELKLDDAAVTDISAIEGMPIQTLSLSRTRVSNLAPLARMPLRDVDLGGLPAETFSPIAGIPVHTLNLENTRVRDLSFVRGMPLESLALNGCREARGFSVLAEIFTLEALLLPDNVFNLPEEELLSIEALRSHSSLRQLAADFMEGQSMSTTGAKERFWEQWDQTIPLVRTLRSNGIRDEITYNDRRECVLRITGRTFSDLSVIRGQKVVELYLHDTGVTDLSPLKGMKLRTLTLNNTRVADLDPLRGMRLEKLYIANTKVTDLSPIAAMPLRELFFDGTAVTNLSVLASVTTLEAVILTGHATDFEPLRKLPQLKRLSFSYSREIHGPSLTAAEFWRARAVQPRGRPPVAIPARQSSASPQQVDLSGFYNAGLQDSWQSRTFIEGNLENLPSGLRTIQRTVFDCRGVIQLAGANPDLNGGFPTEVNGIPVRLKCRALHFLHATGWQRPRGTHIGDYLLHYSDGHEETASMTYGENLSNWWISSQDVLELAATTTVAWRGRNASSRSEGMEIQLYHFTLINPRPHIEIATIDFKSAMTECAPFLIAITGEP